MAFDGIPEVALEMFLGTDWVKDFVVFTDLTFETVRDTTGHTAAFMVKRRLDDADVDALITASASQSGVFNADPDVNTQKWTVTVADTDTDEEITAGVAFWELKRTNANAEKPYVFGKINLRRAVHIA